MNEPNAPLTIAADATFAVVPTWVLAAAPSRAVHLYAVLRRYADYGTGVAWPSRATLAADLSCSVDSVDRAIAALVQVGAVTVVHRRGDDGAPRSNLYRLHATPTGRPVDNDGGVAATVRLPSRTRAQGVAAPVPTEREPLNESTPLPPQSGGATACRRHHRPRRGCAACATPAPSRPVWCGSCDEGTRLLDRPDGTVARCRGCHPLEVNL